MPTRRTFVHAGAALAGAAAVATPALLPGAQAAPAPTEPPPGAPLKTLRLSLPTPETGFDPVQVSDLYSHTLIAHMFESLYGYDHLARPFKIKPETAAGMPEVSSDFRVYTITLQPGIYFADDPAFAGKKRELIAQDYAYSLRRYFDPRLKSPSYSNWAEEGISGLEALHDQAVKSKTGLDYDQPVPGLRVLGRYTLQVHLDKPRPRFLQKLADLPALAREVVQAYGDRIMEHPVGTGPYRLAQWRRSSKLVFERNPNYRELRYDAEPAADDAEGQAILARLKGRRLPMIDRVELSVVEESQPRWLAFLNEEFDLIGVPLEFVNAAAPQGRLAPHLAKRGIRMNRSLGSDVTFFYFNMEDPLVGGYTPDKVALRRAIALASNVQREIQVARRGQAIPAQAGVPPHTYGYDPRYHSENSEFNLGRAKALLDLYGYVDKNGDGWREQPDGRPLVIEYATQPDQISRQFDELWKKNLDALGVKLKFQVRQWPEQLKQARAGQLMLWQLGSSSSSPDGQGALELAYGPSAGGGNLARFKLKAFDALYERINDLPDGPERLSLFTQANKLLTAYMPYKFNVHRVGTELTQPWLIGYRRPLFWRNLWQYLDIERPATPR